MSAEGFVEELSAGYALEGGTIQLGAAMYERAALPECPVRIPLRTLNRHGLIAGATGTGKTVTLQVLAEQLSLAGVPSLLMDIKGDLSGIAAPGTENQRIRKRHEAIGVPFTPAEVPVELLSLSDEPGARLRATVTEFGPVLLSRILGLNDTQEGVVSVVFKYCDDERLPLIDLEDLRRTLQWITGEGKESFDGEYGRVSTASVGAIQRRILALEQQGGDRFFGERSFDVQDLVQVDAGGRGQVSIVRLADLQDRPKLFSTFMLSLLAEIYSTFPEAGDADKPKLVLFLDEAHLLFDQASEALLDQIEAITKLIRSKGVGLFFVTQDPNDVPDEVLGQLGLKVQHALRAFTAKDRRAIKLAAENFPLTDYYDVPELLTGMGIGEAFVTGLNQKGIPTPLVQTMLRAPGSRIGPLTKKEINALVGSSLLAERYNQEIDRESAAELLEAKIKAAQAAAEQERLRAEREKAEAVLRKSTPPGSRSRRKQASVLEQLSKNTMVRQMGRSLVRELTRGILGVLGLRRSGR